MPILTDIKVLYQCREDGAQGDIWPIRDAALVWKEGKITWAGPEKELPKDLGSEIKISAEGKIAAPGLIDCHTHLCFAGSRYDEFEKRAKGLSYLEIAKSGGGIASTVGATRAAEPADLKKRCLYHLNEMLKLGVTAVELKSGYGLSLEAELKTLRVYRELKSEAKQTLVSTLLAAHAIPKEFSEDRSGYVRLIIDEIIPSAAKENLAEYCDAFVEDGAFTYDEAIAILNAGKKHGLKPRIHADQITNKKGAELAALVGAVSADHLENVSEAGIESLKKGGVSAVLLPFSSVYLNQTALNGRRLIDAGVRTAVATNFNPGSAPSYHLPLALTLACTLNRLTPAEALKGASIYAAKIIGRDKDMGSLETGKRADFILLQAENVNDWLYQFRANAVRSVYLGGDRLSPT